MLHNDKETEYIFPKEPNDLHDDMINIRKVNQQFIIKMCDL